MIVIITQSKVVQNFIPGQRTNPIVEWIYNRTVSESNKLRESAESLKHELG